MISSFEDLSIKQCTVNYSPSPIPEIPKRRKVAQYTESETQICRVAGALELAGGDAQAIPQGIEHAQMGNALLYSVLAVEICRT